MVSHAALIAENDGQRSAYIQHQVSVKATTLPPLLAEPIPRVVVQFWHDAADVPPDVSECMESWRPLIEKGFRRVLFDDETARDFIERWLGPTHAFAFDRCRHPAMRCDYFRLCWMLLEGGLYVDADELYLGANCDDLFTNSALKVQPLCYDLSTKAMVPAAVFLNEVEPPSDWIFYVNNNPLIAPCRHPIIRLALERATRLLLRPNPPTDIQSTTGPGNLSASLVRHSIDCADCKKCDFAFLTEWDSIAISRWPLSYRNDERNWRLWDSTQ